MRDERIRRDTCRSFLPKTPKSVTSEFLSPVSAVYAWNAWDHDPPFWRGNRLHLRSLGLSSQMTENFANLLSTKVSASHSKPTQSLAKRSRKYTQVFNLCVLSSLFGQGFNARVMVFSVLFHSRMECYIIGKIFCFFMIAN